MFFIFILQWEMRIQSFQFSINSNLKSNQSRTFCFCTVANFLIVNHATFECPLFEICRISIPTLFIVKVTKKAIVFCLSFNDSLFTSFIHFQICSIFICIKPVNLNAANLERGIREPILYSRALIWCQVLINKFEQTNLLQVIM